MNVDDVKKEIKLAEAILKDEEQDIVRAGQAIVGFLISAGFFFYPFRIVTFICLGAIALTAIIVLVILRFKTMKKFINVDTCRRIPYNLGMQPSEAIANYYGIEFLRKPTNEERFLEKKTWVDGLYCELDGKQRNLALKTTDGQYQLSYKEGGKEIIVTPRTPKPKKQVSWTNLSY